MLNQHWPAGVSRLDHPVETVVADAVTSVFPNQEWMLIIREPQVGSKIHVGYNFWFTPETEGKNDTNHHLNRIICSLQGVASCFHQHGLIPPRK